MSVAVRETDERPLTEVAAEIAVEHDLAKRSLSDALEHAFRAGELLLEARSRVPHGGWEAWLSDQLVEVGLSMEQARTYMRVARNRETVLSSGARSLGAARDMLRERPTTVDSRRDPALIAEARELRARGLLIREVADEMGISANTVQRWCNPEAEERYRSARRRTSRAGRAALRRQERTAAAKAVGGELGRAYSLVRQALDTLERAGTTHPPEVGKHIRSAMTSLYNAEDETARAVRQALS